MVPIIGHIPLEGASNYLARFEFLAFFSPFFRIWLASEIYCTFMYSTYWEVEQV